MVDRGVNPYSTFTSRSKSASAKTFFQSSFSWRTLWRSPFLSASFPAYTLPGVAVLRLEDFGTRSSWSSIIVRHRRTWGFMRKRGKERANRFLANEILNRSCLTPKRPVCVFVKHHLSIGLNYICKFASNEKKGVEKHRLFPTHKHTYEPR